MSNMLKYERIKRKQICLEFEEKYNYIVYEMKLFPNCSFRNKQQKSLNWFV